MATQVERGLLIAELRRSLEQIRASIAGGAPDEALRQIDATLQELDPARLVTMAEVAEVLGIRSATIARLLLGKEGIATFWRGDDIVAPLGEVERIYDSEWVRGIRASDRAHDAIEDFGGPDEMSEEELDILEAGRPGTLPWQR
jgi:hypothetical protein